MRHLVPALLLVLLLPAMAWASADGSVTVKAAVNYGKSLDLQAGSAPIALLQTTTYTNGAGANKAQVVFSDTRSTDSTGEDLDLSGTLKDAFGQTLAFTKIKFISVQASSANTNNVIMGAGTHPLANLFGDAASDTMIVHPGGIFAIVDPTATGYAVTGGSADDLMIKSSGTGTVAYNIYVVGEGTATP